MTPNRFPRVQINRRRAAVLLAVVAALVLISVMSALPTPGLADAGGFPTPTNTLPPVIIPTVTSTPPFIPVTPTAPLFVVGPTATFTLAPWILSLTPNPQLLVPVTPAPPTRNLLASLWPLLAAIVLVAFVVGIILWTTQRRSLTNP